MTDEPAFPNIMPGGITFSPPSLTKRELAAFMAMQGILSNSHEDMPIRPDYVAENAVRQADALLAELGKKND